MCLFPPFFPELSGRHGSIVYVDSNEAASWRHPVLAQLCIQLKRIPDSRIFGGFTLTLTAPPDLGKCIEMQYAAGVLGAFPRTTYLCPSWNFVEVSQATLAIVGRHNDWIPALHPQTWLIAPEPSSAGHVSTMRGAGGVAARAAALLFARLVVAAGSPGDMFTTLVRRGCLGCEPMW